MDGTILIADDDKSIRKVLSQALIRAGCKVQTTSSLTTLIRWINEGKGDLVISDVFMPDGNGIEALSEIKSIRPSLPVIIISAQNSILTAVEAAQATAFDYLSKPFDLIDLLQRVSKALTSKNSKNYLRDKVVHFIEKDLPLIGKSTEMQSLYKLVAKLINIDSPIMILGESGVGKSLIASVIHNFSDLRTLPFKTLHSQDFNSLGGLSTLFNSTKVGTILLDEVADLTMEAQSRLVRLLDTVPGSLPRVISTSQYSLIELMEKGTFRRDLFYRLNAVSVPVPPLRKRIDDVEILAQYFLSQISSDGVPELIWSEGALEWIKSYTWPGNVRQFKNLIMSLVATHRGELVSEKDIRTSLQGQPEIEFPNFGINNVKLRHSAEAYLRVHFDHCGGVLPAPGLYGRIIAEVEKPLLKFALDATRGNQAKCAKMLGINRNTLRKKISEQKIDKKLNPKFN